MCPLPSTASEISDSYGGPYTNQHQTDDPTAEMDAGFGNQELCDVAQMTHTAPRAWVCFNGHTYSGGGTDSIAVVDHDAMWGSGTGVKPTVGQTGTNTFVITWPATVNDQLGASHALNIRFPHEPQTVDATLSRAKVSAFTANTVTLKTFNSAGSANGLSGIPIFVCWN